MKTLLKIFSVFLLISFFGSVDNLLGQWVQQPFPTDESLFKVRFIDEMSGWVLGENAIYKTADGGATWNRQDSTIFEYGTALCVVNSDVVLYSSASTVLEMQTRGIRRTADSGLTWETVDTSLTFYNDFEFITDQIGYAAGGDSNLVGTILKTTDGGASWETIANDFNPSKYELTGISFIDETHGWAVSYDAFIFNTIDRGVTWTLQDSIRPMISFLPLRDIKFVTPDSGWAVGGLNNSIVSTTNDGGKTWTTTVFWGSSLREVTFLNSRIGWAVGATHPNFIYKTIDGGKNWEPQTISPNVEGSHGIESISILQENLGWAVGSYPGRVYKLSSGGPTIVAENGIRVPDHFALGQNYPNPFNSTTNIRFQLPQASRVTITVFNILGHEVATVLNEKRQAGTHQVAFDASKLPGGVYFYRLQAGNFEATRKFILMK